MNAQTKFIVWDWNGTLLDDTADVLHCVNLVLSKVGYPPIDLPTLHDTHKNWPPKPGDEDSDWPVRRFYRQVGVREEDLAALKPIEREVFHGNYSARGESSPLRHGTAALLGEFHGAGIRSFILSNHLVDEIRKQLKRLAIEHYFAEVLAYACRDTQFKDMTKGERLRRFMAQHGHDPKGAIIVGDTVEEIHIAREQGLISVAISGGLMSDRQLHAEKPDHFIHSLHELKPILQERGFVS